MATVRAYADSSNEGSRKPIEKLLTLPGVSWLIIAATALESMPPDRKTPTGTSLISSFRTDSLSTASRSVALSSRLPSALVASLPVRSASQY